MNEQPLQSRGIHDRVKARAHAVFGDPARGDFRFGALNALILVAVFMGGSSGSTRFLSLASSPERNPPAR